MKKEFGEIQESRLLNKHICYLLYNRYPSNIVRATTFGTEFKKNGYKITFYKMYSDFLLDISSRLGGMKMHFIARLFNNINALYTLFRQEILLKSVVQIDAIVIIKYIRSSFLYRLKNSFTKPILYDFDDAVWLDFMLGQQEFNTIIKLVDYVSCDNSILLSRALDINKNSFILNGPTQIEKFIFSNSDRSQKSKNNFVVGWLGSSDTSFYLYSIYNALEKIGGKYKNVVLRIVGSSKNNPKVPKFEKIKTEFVPSYDEQKMIEEVLEFDIGLFPLFENELSRGRGMLKAKIYMSGGVPAICSDIGAVHELIEDGKNGFVAKSEDEWIEKLSYLIENIEQRKEIGINGQKTISERFNKSICFRELQMNFLEKI